MRTIIYSILLMLMVVSVSGAGLEYRRIAFVEDYGDYFAAVRVENTLDRDLEDVHVTVVIQELGLRFRTQGFDVDNEDELSRRVRMEMPDIGPGYYLVRLTTSNDEVRSVKHRPLIIQ